MDDKKIRDFLSRNCLQNLNEYVQYHLLLNIKYGYLKDCMDIVHDIKDGLVFDMVDLAVLFKNYDMALKSVQYFKRKIGLEYESINVSEIVNLRGGSIEESEVKGDTDEIIQLAHLWKRNFSSVQNNVFIEKKEWSKEEIDHAFYLYELAIYTLYLCDRRVNFRDLLRAERYYYNGFFLSKEEGNKKEDDKLKGG